MKAVLFAYFSLITLSLFAQEKLHHEFVGTIRLEDKSIISYKIILDESEDGTFTGKSISDFSGEHRTETSLRGRMNRKRNQISFQEIEDLNTKSDYPSTDFCYIYMYNAKLSLKRRKSTIRGDFFSKFSDGADCLKGDIFLVGEDQFFKKMESVKRKTRFFISDEKEDALEDMLVKSKEDMNNTILKNDEQLSFKVQNDELFIKIWDDEYVDNDVVTISTKDSVYLSNYSVIDVPKVIRIELKEKETRIVVVANSEGKIPPNSANISISDRVTELPIKTRLDLNKSIELIAIKSSDIEDEIKID